MLKLLQAFSFSCIWISSVCLNDADVLVNLLEDFTKSGLGYYANLIYDKTLDKKIADELEVTSVKISTKYLESDVEVNNLIHRFKSSQRHIKIVATVCTSYRTNLLLHQALMMNILNDNSVWLVFARNTRHARWIRDRLTLAANSHVMLVMLNEIKDVKNDRNKSINIFGATHSFYDNRTKLRVIGRWSYCCGLVMSTKPTFCCPDLTGLHLVVTTIQNPPFVTMKDNKTTGIAWDVLVVIAEILNFRFTLVPVEDNGFGILSNGNWSGMVQTLLSKRAEIALGDFALTLDRMKVVDYTIPCGRDRFAMLFRKQSPSKLSWHGYISVLNISTWIVSLFCYFLVTATLSFISLFKPSTDDEDFKTGDYWHIVLSIFSMQSLAEEPKRMSSRFLTLCTWYITYVLFLCYSSILISHLITNDNSAPISDVKTLLTSSTYKPMFVKSAATYHIIKAAHPDVSSDAWKRVEENANDFFVDTMADGIEATFRQKVGFVSTSKSLSLFQERNKSFVVVEVPSIPPRGWSILLQKDSPYLAQFNRVIMKMHESGIMERIRRKYRLKQITGSNTRPSPIEVQQAQFPFFILLMGIVTAIILLLFELLYRSKCDDGVDSNEEDTRYNSRRSERIDEQIGMDISVINE